MPTAWIEVERNNEKMILVKNTDGDDRMVTVLSRLAMWKSEIRVDSRQNLGRENEFRWWKHNVGSRHRGESARET